MKEVEPRGQYSRLNANPPRTETAAGVRGGFIGVSLALLTTTLVGLTPTAHAGPLPAGTRIETSEKCAYPKGVEIDGSKYTFFGTDSKGYFTVAPTPDLPGGHWEIHGEFPLANAFGFESVNSALMVEGTIKGEDIIADPGSVNPYQPGNSYTPGKNFYTLKVEFAPPSQRDTTLPSSVIYAGYRMANKEDGTEPRRHIGSSGVMLTVMGGVTEIGGTTDMKGGVPLPTVTWVVDDASKNIIKNKRQLCFEQYKATLPLQPLMALFLNPLQRFADWQTEPLKKKFIPSWFDPTSGDNGRPYVSVLRPGPQGYSFPLFQTGHYVLTAPNPKHGRFYVIRYKNPRTSHVAQGIPNTGNEQLAYYDWCGLQMWSIFLNTSSICLGSEEIISDEDGYVTLVVSPKNERPVINGKPYFNWIEHPGAGGTVWMYSLNSNRDTWPESPYFTPDSWSVAYDWPNLTKRIKGYAMHDYVSGRYREAELEQWMGEYYPEVYYCNKETFEAGQCKPLDRNPASGG